MASSAYLAAVVKSLAAPKVSYPLVKCTFANKSCAALLVTRPVKAPAGNKESDSSNSLIIKV